MCAKTARRRREPDREIASRSGFQHRIVATVFQATKVGSTYRSGSRSQPLRCLPAVIEEGALMLEFYLAILSCDMGVPMTAGA